MLHRARRIRILTIIISVCSIVALLLFFLNTFVFAEKSENSTSDSEIKLQAQIDELSSKLSVSSNIIAQLQTQIKDVTTRNNSSSDQVTLTRIEEVSAENLQLKYQIDTLNADIATIQDQLKLADMTIGITPINVNGLSVLFITNDIQIGMTGSDVPGSGQFAIKIANSTGSTLTNVDITGTITSSQYFTGAIAAGYPQLIDGSGLCSYVYYITQGNVLNFEAFGIGKTSLSIPAGSSITIRPKISVLAAEDQYLPAMTFSIALKTITYDKAVTK